VKKNYPEATDTITVEVGDVVFLSKTEAALYFELKYTGGVMFGKQIGYAKLIDGQWKIARDTMCMVFLVGRRTVRPAAGSVTIGRVRDRPVVGADRDYDSELAGTVRSKSMDFDLPSEDDPRRAEIRKWLAEHPHASGRQLADAGYVAPHWPKPYGLDADPIHQLVIDDELRRANVRRPENMIGIGWAGPTILHAGSEAQKDRYLLPLLAGEEVWCQLFSEPGAGSDLAGLRTRAERDGDEYIVNGQKIWTSGAHMSKFAS